MAFSLSALNSAYPPAVERPRHYSANHLKASEIESSPPENPSSVLPSGRAAA